MADPAAERWTIDEFFAWQETQPERFELVDGFPLGMMAGAKNAHDLIAVNILTSLKNQLRGGGCRPFTGEGSVETFPGQIRRPDVGVDCGKWNPEAYKASEPKLVVEVLSPTTRDFDAFGKLPEYRQVASLECILLVEPNAPQVRRWERGPDRDWIEIRHQGLEAVIEIAASGVRLPLAEIYEDISFPAGPRLVMDVLETNDGDAN
jgi:Uma2 family endonuclease